MNRPNKFSCIFIYSSPDPCTVYNVALCHYKLKQYGPSLKHIGEIIERGIREHPELSIGCVRHWGTNHGSQTVHKKSKIFLIHFHETNYQKKI